MKNGKRMLLAVALAGAAMAPVLAQHAAPHPAHAKPATAGAATPHHAYTDGEVRGLDRANLKVTLKGGEIPNIDMPPMTMAFHVKDAKMLDHLKPGDKVKFRAINDAGKFTLTELVPVK